MLGSMVWRKSLIDAYRLDNAPFGASMRGVGLASLLHPLTVRYSVWAPTFPAHISDICGSMRWM